MKSSKLIIISGPESSGKTYLGRMLASRFQLKLIEEYARTYIDDLNRSYTQDDLLVITKGQYQSLAKLKDPPPLILMDTDGLTVKIWSEEKFKSCDPEIINLWQENLPDYYLLCKPDIPWEYDPQRENPADRNRLFSIYLKEIEATGIPFAVIEGSYSERSQQRESIIERLLANEPLD